MQREIELAYLGIEVPDPASLSSFFGDVIGLLPGDAVGTDGLSWRNDSKVHRVIVEPGAANDASFVGFEAGDDDAFRRVVAACIAAGFDVSEDDADVVQAASRRPPRSRDAHRGAYRRDRRRLGGRGHAVRLAADARWLPHRRRGLRSCRLRDDGVRRVASLPRRRPRARPVGLAGDGARTGDRARGALLPLQRAASHRRAGEGTVRASAEAAPLHGRDDGRDDVGAAFDRAWATDLPIPNGLGRHDNDGMFSFYVTSPAGFQGRGRPRRQGRDRRLGRQPPSTTASAPGATSRCGKA